MTLIPGCAAKSSSNIAVPIIWGVPEYSPEAIAQIKGAPAPKPMPSAALCKQRWQLGELLAIRLASLRVSALAISASLDQRGRRHRRRVLLRSRLRFGGVLNATYGKRALHPTPRTFGRCDGRQSSRSDH